MSAENDIKAQEPNELQIANFFAKAKGGLIQAKRAGRDKAKDFTVFLPTTIEIKTDYRAAETGNVFFEYFNCRLREASGLWATKSDVWCHVVPPSTVYTFPPKAMVFHIEQQRERQALQYTFVTGAGDDNSDGVYFKIPILESLPFVKRYEIDFEIPPRPA